MMIDSREAPKFLRLLEKKMEVDFLGAHSYDGVELLVCAWDRKFSRMVELKRAERLWVNGVHQSGWYELPLPKSFRLSLNDSSVRFKPYQFLRLEDIAYHLKIYELDVEAAVARVVLKQALEAGIHIEKHDGLDGKIFKLGSLEELQVLGDLLG